MIRIAIVDDEESVASGLEDMISKYCVMKNVPVITSCFNDAHTFLNAYSGDYDMVFMDIRMSDLNGLDAAHLLRKRDEDIIIVFVTNLRQYAIKGYAVRAFDYIVKPVEEYALFTLLDKVVTLVSSRAQRTIMVKTKNKMQRVVIQNIKYIEVQSHKLRIKMNNAEIETWGALSAIETHLPEDSFVRCNNCYIVNLRYVTGVDGDDVLVGGDRLKISRTRKKDFLTVLARFCGEGV